MTEHREVDEKPRSSQSLLFFGNDTDLDEESSEGQMMDGTEGLEKRVLLGMEEETVEDLEGTGSVKSIAGLERVSVVERRGEQLIRTGRLDNAEGWERIKGLDGTERFKWAEGLDQTDELDRKETVGRTEGLDTTTRLEIIYGLNSSGELGRTEELEMAEGTQMSDEVEMERLERTEELDRFDEVIGKQKEETTPEDKCTAELKKSSKGEMVLEVDNTTEVNGTSEVKEGTSEVERTPTTERTSELEMTSELEKTLEIERTPEVHMVAEGGAAETLDRSEDLERIYGLESIAGLENTVGMERRDVLESTRLTFPCGVFQRVRRDTLESQASSIDFSDDALESDDSSDVGFSRQPASNDPISAAVRRRLNNRVPQPRQGPGSSDDETDHDGREPFPPVLQRSTTFERVLSDAIVHQAPIEELKVILDAGAKLMDPSARKPNPIHYTVWQRYPDAAELLLQQGYDVNALDDFGYSALHLAARHGYTDMMEILIKHGSAINFNPLDLEERFPIDAVEEPLRMALKYGHRNAAKLLLENGANPNGRYFFGSEINLASPLQPELLELLLEFGARVNEQDRNGLTPIMKACRLRQGMESLLLLLSYGGDVNIRADRRHDHRTALHYAVLSGSVDIVLVLLDSGAQVRFEPEYNRPTPLHLAVRRGDIKMINLLLDVGANINSSTTLIGSVLHMACSEKVTNRLEVMEFLLARGADPNIIVPGLDGSPMLPPLGDYLAASDEHDSNVINLLLRYGAEVIMKSPQTSPLGLLGCVSALRQQPLILEELLEGAQQFDLGLIRYTSLLGSEERRLCLEIAGSPLSLRHLSRVCIRHESATARPESVLKMELPSIISKYLLYEIS